LKIREGDHSRQGGKKAALPSGGRRSHTNEEVVGWGGGSLRKKLANPSFVLRKGKCRPTKTGGGGTTATPQLPAKMGRLIARTR